MTARRDYLALTRLHGISQSMATTLVKELGSIDEILKNVETLPIKIRNAFQEGWTKACERAEQELDFCEKKNIQILIPENDNYPQRLKECNDAPLALFYKGTANLNKRHIISVVGTRHISEYGKDICHNFINELKTLIPDCMIVSGLAYGVDIHAHRASISSNMETVGVLAHGLDRIYPHLHRNTAIEMMQQGGLLTEYMTGTNPDKGNFVRRNRIVAGMSDATVVVESAHKGGALITAHLANDYAREVFAFPGRIHDEFSEGCHQLIKSNKAALITCAKDLTENMGWDVSTNAPTPIQRELFPELSDEETLLCELLKGSDGMAVNQLVVKSNLPFANVSVLLFELEMKGVVKAMPGGNFRLL